ncbi:MAG: hypothetical protein A2315_01170 [Ignavibacteria bacterium RIFOXYB2_FULL_35_12]|nr:MAG: hypothetical protein A2058_10270 [Ignavibacteria bacterium GWA2_36_19]OGU52998.1 MAG: hypothetical protein A2006_06540 [Ignavibacteria bacterium GWC2_35_8]OGU56025.1 MAG: hypothetical protein A2X60_15050 [Ignavibacteria bacterium GWF2_35_20]OGU77541.1 MAG: hypothetical protein A2W11_09610 [Ignavibacteria bacterium RBG_16_35_7]OGU83997.1 MAG: hypothetical protein A3K31_14225 [Ignavibacteria bacterium RIFOXYA12_FULL_35_25]OGU91964.1 MAG: hypothetical protein A2492_15015 [Ignavibacteria b
MRKSLRNKNKSYCEVLSGLYSEALLAKMPKKVLTEIAEKMYLSGKIDILPDDQSEYDDSAVEAPLIRVNVQSKFHQPGQF